jgi:Bacterial PH domain
VAVYRNDATARRLRTTALLVGGCGLVGGTLGAVRHYQGATGWLGATSTVILFVVGVIGLSRARRLEHIAIETDREGLTVRNVWSTRRYAWPDVAEFGEGRRRGMTLAYVRTQDGKAHALSASGDPDVTCRRILDSLRKELERARRRA